MARESRRRVGLVLVGGVLSAWIGTTNLLLAPATTFAAAKPKFSIKVTIPQNARPGPITI